MDDIVLRKPQPEIQPTAPLYLRLPAIASPGANLPPGSANTEITLHSLKTLIIFLNFPKSHNFPKY